MNIFTWFEKQGQAVVSVKKLTGLTACSQLICVTPPLADGRDRFVLRQQSERASSLGVSYTLEAKILQALPFSFAPKVYYAYENGSLLDWIDGRLATAFTPLLLSQLANHLANLHRFPIPADFPHFDISNRCQCLWEKLPLTRQNALPISPPFEPIKPFTQAICHHDLHLGNFIRQGEQLFLIDWEYSAISDPALEIALFFHGNSLNEADKRLFLADYLQQTKFEPNAFQQKMAEYLPAIDALNQLWFALS